MDTMRYMAALWLMLGLIALGAVSPVAAQDAGGQFCVRSYEDTNANGIFDTESERLITRGVSVELLEASGVVVSSALLDQSPNASLGLICFYNLSPGEYTVLMSSADYVATTQRLVTETVDSTAPTIIEFGGRRVANTGSSASSANTGDSGIMAQLASPTRTQILVAAVGTVVIMILLAIAGIVIYALTNRQRSPRPVTYNEDSVRALDTEEYVPPPEETEPPVTDEDTNPTAS